MLIIVRKSYARLRTVVIFIRPDQVVLFSGHRAALSRPVSNILGIFAPSTSYYDIHIPAWLRDLILSSRSIYIASERFPVLVQLFSFHLFPLPPLFAPFPSRFLISRRVFFKYWNSGPCTFSPRPSKGSIDERINEILSGSHSRFFLSSSAASLYQRDATQRLSIPRSSNVKKRTSRIHMDDTATNPRIHEADSARCLAIVEKSKPCSNDYDDECSGVRAFGCLAKRQGTSLHKFDSNIRLEFLIRLNVPFNHRLGERSVETRNNVNISNRRRRSASGVSCPCKIKVSVILSNNHRIDPRIDYLKVTLLWSNYPSFPCDAGVALV